MTVEMFRIRYSWKRGAVSSGEVEHFESRERFVMRLLDLHAEALSNPEHGRWTFATRLARLLKARGKRSEREHHRTPVKVYLAQQLVADEWVDVEHEFVPAKLLINGEEYSDD